MEDLFLVVKLCGDGLLFCRRFSRFRLRFGLLFFLNGFLDAFLWIVRIFLQRWPALISGFERLVIASFTEYREIRIEVFFRLEAVHAD